MPQKAADKPAANFYVDARLRVVDRLRQQLIGPPEPAQDGARLIHALPTERFPCGALYPITAGEGIDPASEDDDDDAIPIAGQEAEKEPAVVRRYIPPSSTGFSFFIKGTNIRFQALCRAACYKYIERGASGRFKKTWEHHRQPSHGDEECVDIALPLPQGQPRASRTVLDGRARLDIESRRFADGWLVTASLCNTKEIDSEAENFKQARAENTLFEAALRCVILEGEVGAYPRVNAALLGDEELEIELQYAGRHVWALGHGSAAQWIEQGGRVKEIYTDAVPFVEVPQMTADTSGHKALSISLLCSAEHPEQGAIAELSAFIEEYADWVEKQSEYANQLIKSMGSKNYKYYWGASKRIINRMEKAVERMRAALALLRSDAQVRLAFALANQAMLRQMQQSGRQPETCRWRPFQLAFLLTVLESAANPDSDFRDTLDLIWFPTGGGKTEAYLGLIAFQIALRRLRHPDNGGGCAVLMRYTLRLLTRDQFIRATRLIFALELLRRERSDLGAEPVSIGMWVGEHNTPNTYKQAAEELGKTREAGGKLVLNCCPWCGGAFTPEQNYDCTPQRLRFVCRNPECAFGAADDGMLPCNVVDEGLYENPPTMLVATIDKFASLTWKEESNAFFGFADQRHLPPELIIQDELHLIASALGSVAGLYEAGIDTAIRARGMRPKYIASTATICMAAQQVRRLYGREAAIFPPPGISCDDSFFAKTVPLSRRPGRMYLGYLAPMLGRQQCMAPLAAALLLAPHALFEHDENRQELLDAWWTQVVYHGSIKGVQNSHIAFGSAVEDFAALLHTAGQDAMRHVRALEELTSKQSAEENAAIFARLKTACHSAGCLDAVLATNMISVGLDVARLGLMLINGQPLTTAEYIQASSRVGRGDVPGLVAVNYYRDQARSLSHYESFRPYHDAFYRFVEPSSVTPFTHQARLRALHAALVIAVRHGVPEMLPDASAGNFRMENQTIANLIELFKRRCQQAITESGQYDAVAAHIDALAREWQSECMRDPDEGLCYHRQRKMGFAALLRRHGDAPQAGLWATLNNMRNVENNALLKVL